MVLFYVSPVTDKLQSANDFANGEKTQDLSRDNTCRYQLLPVDVPDPTENAVQGYRVCSILSRAEESCRVTKDVYKGQKI